MDLKTRIKDSGYSISRVAEALGITQSALSQQINNNTISLARTKEVADIIGMPLPELVSEGSSRKLRCPYCGKPLHVAITGDD